MAVMVAWTHLNVTCFSKHNLHIIGAHIYWFNLHPDLKARIFFSFIYISIVGHACFSDFNLPLHWGTHLFISLIWLPTFGHMCTSEFDLSAHNGAFFSVEYRVKLLHQLYSFMLLLLPLYRIIFFVSIQFHF